MHVLTHQQADEQPDDQAHLNGAAPLASAQLESIHSQASTVPKPAPVTHCSAFEQPGQAWLKFALDRERVLRHLAFLSPAMMQTAA